jgi:hypothetical protein
MSSSATCSIHPDHPAAFHCPQCATAQCTGCADHRWTGSGFADLCRTCEAPLVPGAQRGRAFGLAPLPGNLAYLRRLPQFLAFPFRRDTLLILLWVAASICLLRWLRWVLPGHLGTMALVFSLGIDIAVYVHFITRTGLGKPGLRPEDFDDLQQSVIAPAGRYLLALLPIVAGVMWYVWDRVWLPGADLAGTSYAILTQGGSFGPVLLIALGLLLLPLLTIIAAMGSARSVIDPRMWLLAVRGVGPTYPAGMLAFYAVWAVEFLVWLPLLQRAAGAVAIPVVTTVLVTFLSYLPMALRARLLGGVIEPHRAHFE